MLVMVAKVVILVVLYGLLVFKEPHASECKGTHKNDTNDDIINDFLTNQSKLL